MPSRALIGWSHFLVAMALALPAPAQADVTRKKAIWGPTTVEGKSAFPIYADLGAGIYQMSVAWSSVAPRRPERMRDPADPAYVWPAAVDDAIREASRHGIAVSLMVIGTPSWANGGLPPNWAPHDAGDLARFLTAASRRWPRVRHWMIWGEPTRQHNFMPNPTGIQARDPVRATRRLTVGARRYAVMLDRAYDALKAVRRSNIVIGGNSFVTGDVGPYNWIRWLKLPNGHSPRMDMWGHNPFGAREPDLARGPVGFGLADFSDLDSLARWLDRYIRPRPAGRKLKLFLSEYQIPTDHPNYEFNFYTTRETQARFLRSALEIVRGWNRIYTLGYHSLLDEPPNGRGDHVARGLMDHRGRPKPGYYAFKRG